MVAVKPWVPRRGGWVSMVTSLAVLATSTAVLATAEPSAAAGLRPPPAAVLGTSTPGHTAAAPGKPTPTPASSVSVTPPARKLPAAGRFTLDLGAPATGPVWQPLAGTGISLAAVPSPAPQSGNAASVSPAPPPATPAGGLVVVDVLSQAQAAERGLSGIVLRITGGAGRPVAGGIAVRVDPRVLDGVFGADYASRVQWAQLPDGNPGVSIKSQRARPIGAVSASPVAQAPASGTSMLLATTSSAGTGGTGSLSATSLSPSSSWDVSAQTGDFAWSYPLRVPPVAAGPSPGLALAYSSGAVDGETGSSNNQPSAVGDGWALAGGGFIERSYVPCAADTASGSPATGDLCWKTDNATLSFGRHSGVLVRDDSTGGWRLRADDGSRIEKLGGASNGTYNGEYWKLTTPDGTQYFFGQNRLPGWSATAQNTNSAWTVPVFGNGPGEPCHAATFAQSSCAQGWRWNLDYVVDPHGNSEAYYYTPETNSYASNLADANATPYVRGGFLARIDYGMRAGSELSALAPQRVVFNPADRCIPGQVCDSAHPGSWPDVPWDQSCAGPPCTGKYSPTFWSTKRLDVIHTQLLSGATYSDVDSWALTQSYPSPNDTTSAALWLAKITHTGTVGGSVAMPDTVMSGTQLQNRVWAVDGLAPLMKWRISSIRTDTGAIVSVNYLPAECTPTNLPAAPETNTKRCYPQWWTPQTTPPQPAQLDWFNKYPVASVITDPVTGGGPVDQMFYDYTGTPGWRYETSPLVSDDKRTWSDYAGYSKIRIRHGDQNQPTAQQSIDYLYFQGMDGDRAGPAGGLKTASITASDGTSISDARWFAGQVREQVTTLGPGGPVVGGTISDPWASAATATGGGATARIVNTGETRTRTALSAGGFRNTQTQNGFDGFGRATTINDLGDTTTAADDRCIRTSYADNPAGWLHSYPVEVTVVAKACPLTATLPADAISDTRTSYDGGTPGSPPTRGDPTTTEVVKAYTGATPTWLTTATTTFDPLGRVSSVTDPRVAPARTTSTAYTPAAGGPLTQTVVTNPLGWTTTTGLLPAWGVESFLIDQNAHRTDASYDALGRRTQVWLPQRPKASNAVPSMSYAYTDSVTTPVSVATTTIAASGGTVTAYALFDGLGRPRQTQAPSEGGGKVITDTGYDSAGRVVSAVPAYFNVDSAPSGTLFVPATTVPAETRTLYDGAGRKTADVLYTAGVEKWRTSYGNGGDHTDVTPPAGGTATTTFADARGQKTKLLQYHGPTPVGAADTTSYSYNTAGAMSAMSDPAGNTWTWGFDVLGRQTQAHDPDKGNTTTAYDDAARVTSTIDGRGQGLAYSYDGLDRKTGESAYINNAWVPQTAFTFDTVSKGQPSSSTRYVGSTPTTLGTAYTQSVTGYDVADRPTGTQTVIGGVSPLAGTYTNTATYAPDGSIATTTDAAMGGLPAERLRSFYTAQGHLYSYGGHDAYMPTITYTHLNQVAQTAQSNGTTAVYQTFYYQDGTQRLNRLLSTTGASTNFVAADRAYTYNNAGGITSATDSPSAVPIDTQCYTQDYLAQLTQAWTPNTNNCAAAPSTATLGGPAPYWTNYAYDSTGNRTGVTRHATTAGAPDLSDTYAYPGPGQAQPHGVSTITHTSSTGTPTPSTDTYAYDGTGNTTTRPGQTLTYDPQGHQGTVSAGTQTQNDIYDAAGNRLVHTDNTGTTIYLGDTELHTNPGASTVSGTRTYTALARPVAVRTATTAVLGSTVNWLDTDPQNTATVAIDTLTGATTRRHNTPFGAPRDPAAPVWPDNHGFLNKPVDPLTATTHLGAREYDPALGRFLSVDPVLDPSQPQQNNAYSYAWNNPITGADPTGLMRLADGYDGYNGYVGTYRGAGGSASPPSPGGGIKYPLVQPRAPSISHAPATRSKSTWEEAKQLGVLIGMGIFDVGAITVDAAQFGLDPVTDAGTALAVAGTADLASELMGEGAAAAKSEGSLVRTFQTYTKPNAISGEMYAGRTSGFGTPLENLARRDGGHAYNDLGFGPARLDRSSVNPAAIRGREQQLIQSFRDQGISANKINGISPTNPNGPFYLRSATDVFGSLP
jgi:RHS repeat-associated protein